MSSYVVFGVQGENVGVSSTNEQLKSYMMKRQRGRK